MSFSSLSALKYVGDRAPILVQSKGRPGRRESSLWGLRPVPRNGRGGPARRAAWSDLTVPNVLDAIVAWSAREPGRRAVADLDQDLSYSALETEVTRLAAGLKTMGVRPGDRVALHLPNSVDFVLAALASLWIGAAFVPLAVTDPDARLSLILSDCAPAISVTGEPGAERRSLSSSVTSSPIALLAELRSAGGTERPPRVTGDDAYAIYTSGTSGTPKGVLIGVRAFAAAVASGSLALGLDVDTRTLCVSPFHFDGSFGTLFFTLYRGGSVVIRPRDTLLLPRSFFLAVADENITYTGFSPTYLRLLLATQQVARLAESKLELVALGGEAATADDVRAFWKAVPEVRLFNRYGPTEATIAVTHLELTPEVLEDDVVPIGRPHPGVSFHLVDEEGRLVHGPHSIGELYIGGDQLMPGYLGAPELSAEVLRTDIDAGEVLNRTGDPLRTETTMAITSTSMQADRVIKRNGVRISLLEVALTFRHLPGVSDATCAAYDDDGQVGIAVFVVAEPLTSARELQNAARIDLPLTMLPNRIELVTSLPLNSSNKLDERTLLAAAGLRPLASSNGKPRSAAS